MFYVVCWLVIKGHSKGGLGNDHLYNNYAERNQEHQNGNSVHAMHQTQVPAFRNSFCLGLLLPKHYIAKYFIPNHSH
jgi:hypothetical protein